MKNTTTSTLNVYEFNEWLAAANHRVALQSIAEGADPADVQADCRGSALFAGIVQEFYAYYPDQNWDYQWSVWYENCQRLGLASQPCWGWEDELA